MIGDLELVDGGTLDPVPVAAARSLVSPKTPVVAVVLSTQMGIPAQTWNIPLPDYLPRTIITRLGQMRYSQALDVFLRSLDMVNRAVTEYRLQVDDPDVIIRPAVVDVDILDQVDVRAIARKGEEAVETVLPELKKLFAWQNRLRRAVGV
jgi:NTE family protein